MKNQRLWEIQWVNGWGNGWRSRIQNFITWLSIHALSATPLASPETRGHESRWPSLRPFCLKHTPHFPTGPSVPEQGESTTVLWIVKVWRSLCRRSWWPATSSYHISLFHKNLGIENSSFLLWCLSHVIRVHFSHVKSTNLGSGTREAETSVCASKWDRPGFTPWLCHYSLGGLVQVLGLSLLTCDMGTTPYL